MKLAPVLLAACAASPASPPGGGTDSKQLDAPGMLSVEDVACDSFTSTTTSASGASGAQTTKYALVTDVDPASYFMIELCDFSETVNGAPLPTPTCPIGDTCTTSGTPLPSATHVCTWTNEVVLHDNAMLIQCGSTTVSTTAGGTVTTTDIGYSAIRVHH